MYVPTTGPLICPHCSGNKVVGYGVKKGQIFYDVPKRGKPTIAAIDRHRYRCNSCHKTFLERLPGLDDRRNVSLRLISFIEKHSLQRSYLSVAHEVGLSEGTVRNIFHDFLVRLEAGFHPSTPEVLSFDTITLIKKPRYFATNFRRHGIVSFLPDTGSGTLAAYLEQLSDKDQVKTVIMDINPAGRELVRHFLPTVQIIVNPAHLINTILRILQDMRKTLRQRLKAKELRLLAHDKDIIEKRFDELTVEDKERLKSWEKSFKKFVLAYWRKEELRVILQMGDKEEAMKIFLDWQQNVLADGISEYLPVIDTVFEWREEIFAWIDLHAPRKDEHYGFVAKLEATIEGKMDRGYSFEAVKARLLKSKESRPGWGINLRKIQWEMATEDTHLTMF